MFLYPEFPQNPLSYDEYWKKMIGTEFDKINSFQRQRAHFVLNNISPNDTICDLGCGNGSVIKEIRKFRHHTTYAVDYSRYVLEKLESMDFKTLYFDLNEPNLFPKLPRVDHFLMLEVLEHLPQSENFLKESLAHANKSVFFSFPNTGYIVFRSRLMMGKFPMQWVTHPGEHLRFWTYVDLKWWLKELGLYDKANIKVYGGWPIMNKIWPNLFGRGMIVQIKK
jgi:2-polyprenyl-3-methyl-5-hydroxy-6-metoxy-1,4-benzoquinol methylase